MWPRPEPEERRSTLPEERALGTRAVAEHWQAACLRGLQEASGVRKVPRDSPGPFHPWSAMRYRSLTALQPRVGGLAANLDQPSDKGRGRTA
jgi:hypothetical protein